MGRRALVWALTTPLATAGILAAHAVAYRLTGMSSGPSHDYLEHAPQVVLVLASLGLVGLALQERSLSRRSLWWFVPLGPLGFACQEHLERLVHTGHVPWLLTSPTFVVGLLLQIPVVLFSLLVARRVAGTLARARTRRPATFGGPLLPASARPTPIPRPVDVPLPTGRGPPALLAS
ncbi:MAG TPA: hypothetical protein VF073_07410 [Gaiella sp.]